MAPAHRVEFEDWHSHEHFPERLGIPGFLRGSRWADAAGAMPGATTGLDDLRLSMTPADAGHGAASA